MSEELSSSILPDRYSIREDKRGRYLTCIRAQNIFVRIERGETVPAAAARKQRADTIFLDGAAEGGPLMDPARRAYNLDHAVCLGGATNR